MKQYIPFVLLIVFVIGFAERAAAFFYPSRVLAMICEGPIVCALRFPTSYLVLC